jgi:benzodiazapine receptor
MCCAGDARVPLVLFGIQLALNWAWTPIFFHYHELGWVSLGRNCVIFNFQYVNSKILKILSNFAFQSVVEMLALYGSVLACSASFYKVNRTAGLIMIPYLTWLTLATALNYTIWRDNQVKVKAKD